MRSLRRSRGQSIVETAVGLMFLVPIVLFLLDMAVIHLAKMANNNLAKTCARAAASATDNTVTPPIGDVSAANTAAISAAASFAPSAIINPSGGPGTSFLTGFGYLPPLPTGTNVQTATSPMFPGTLPAGSAAPAALTNAPLNGQSTGQVGCVTTMVVTLPVPFPLVPSTMTFVSVDVEPIVSVQPGM